MKIIFVCTGNTCRSPMAAALAKEALAARGLTAEIASRGVGVYCPESASENAIAAMRKYGLDISEHLSRPVSATDINEADLVLTMSQSHKQVLKGVCGDSGKPLFTLKEFVGEQGDICDPYGRDLPIYEECAAELSRCINILADILAKDA